MTHVPNLNLLRGRKFLNLPSSTMRGRTAWQKIGGRGMDTRRVNSNLYMATNSRLQWPPTLGIIFPWQLGLEILLSGYTLSSIDPSSQLQHLWRWMSHKGWQIYSDIIFLQSFICVVNVLALNCVTQINFSVWKQILLFQPHCPISLAQQFSEQNLHPCHFFCINMLLLLCDLGLWDWSCGYIIASTITEASSSSSASGLFFFFSWALKLGGKNQVGAHAGLTQYPLSIPPFLLPVALSL